MTYLGIDLGTSGVKTLLMNSDQVIIGSANAALDVSRPHDGWSEQDPAHWVEAVSQTIDELRHNFRQDMKLVRGIGLSGHMHGATLLDQDGTILRPCILWNDTRSHAEAAVLDADPIFREKTGNIVFPGFTAPKLLWVYNHEPSLFEKIHKVLLPKDYLRYWLTGAYVSDMSDASGTSWLDVGNRQWDDALLAATYLKKDHMPALVEGSSVSGVLRQELAEKWEMNADIIVAGGAGDNAASAIGMGYVSKGNAFLSLGTSGVLFAVNDAFKPNAKSAVHAFCHALPDTWHQMGVILSATDSLNWLARLTATKVSDLDSALPSTLGKPSGITFLPYLAGERTPHNDARIRGSFIGLDHQADKTAMTQSVLEGVSFAFKDCLNALAAAGTDIEKVTAIGGGAKSHYWLQLLATVLNVEIDNVEAGDFGAAFGAARLGFIAAEGLDPLDVCWPPKVIETIVPKSELTAPYNTAYQTYSALYPALKSTTTKD